ncbi:fibrobacter succinogenes major paralogous domain-containing protein [Candidatus Saccharibacteria bacterium]|nr:fibrobacter succinogenes major paralogous domain-containing protein [Candidatus Saccharibacteria bacterium]
MFMHKKLLASCGVSIAAVCSLTATICTPPPETSAISSRVDLELSDVVSIRILDKTATTAIDSLDLELVATPTGAFTSDNFIVEAATSNRTGYKLYMSTDFQSGDPAEYTTDLVNQEDGTYTIPPLGTGGVSLADFSQARGSYVNRWGYSLDNLTYDPVPAHDTTEEIGSSSTASAADRTDVYIGVNANMDKISGLYKNTLVFSGVANPIQTDYTLHFLPGTTDAVTGLPTDQSVSEISASHTFTIPSTAPSRVGYNFTGYTDGTNTYQPSDSITVLGGEDYTGSATLTAQWEVIPIPYMQDQTYIDQCKIAATGTEFELTDSRDNNEYTVAKLKDGKCWMTENLKLVGNATVGYTDLTTTDSDVPTAGFRLTSSNSGTWCTTNSAACDNQSMVLNSGNDSYGTYYNWYAATAGTGKYETSSGNASNSICPRGWRLPTSGSSGEFQALYSNYNSASAMMSSPVNFVLSGRRYGSSTSSRGSGGYYWSSTALSSSYAYNLYLDSSNVYPADNFHKYYGFAVRCVAR